MLFSNVDRDSLLEKTIRIRSKFGCCELKCWSQMLREDNTASNVVKLHQDKILYMVPQFTRMGRSIIALVTLISGVTWSSRQKARPLGETTASTDGCFAWSQGINLNLVFWAANWTWRYQNLKPDEIISFLKASLTLQSEAQTVLTKRLIKKIGDFSCNNPGIKKIMQF